MIGVQRQIWRAGLIDNGAPSLAARIELPQERVARRALELGPLRPPVRHRNPDDDEWIDRLSFIGYGNVAEIEKNQSTDRFQASDAR
jgi:hypothetical protein